MAGKKDFKVSRKEDEGTIFLSSTMGVKFSHFLFWDSVRTLLTCPVSVWVGYRFGPYAHEIIKPYKDWLLLLIVLVAAVLIGRERIRRRKKLKSAGMAEREEVLSGSGCNEQVPVSSFERGRDRS